MEDVNMLWFYLEPYVFVSEDEDYYLFYNSKTKKGLSFGKNKIINKVVRYLQNPDTMYSIRIGIKELEAEESLYNLIKSLQEATFGDLIEGHLPKPVIMPPILHFQQSAKFLKTDLSLIRDEILLNLHETTIFLNGKCTYQCKECQHIFKQYPCCTKSNHTLDFNSLNNFIYSISNTVASINITGGNPFIYPELWKLFNIFEKIHSLKTFIVNFRNIPEDQEILCIFSKESFRLKIIVNGSYHQSMLVARAERLQQLNINQFWEVSVTSLHEYEKAECLREKLARNNIEIKIKPFYNGKNFTFFEEHIFMKQEDLLEIALDRQGVFALQELNTYKFGKITIMPDGKIYADINKYPIGNIREPIYDVLYRELISGDSWRQTRYKIKPCNQCRFKLICPSPSSYESLIGKHNLCHVKQ